MNVVEIVKELIKIPSESGNEKGIAEFIAGMFKNNGIKANNTDGNILAVKGQGNPVLLLNAHMDTVSPTDSWTRDPFNPVEEDGKIYGLGANDDKGSLAALLYTFINIDETKLKGTLIFSATCEEETGGDGLAKIAEVCPKPTAVLVGEPTNFKVCSSQKGQVRIILKARGVASHAARPIKGNNAVVKAANDVVKIDNLKFDTADELLGFPTVESTVINGGTKQNVIPDYCEVVLDGRTTNIYNNERVIEMIEEICESEVFVKSKRIKPRSTLSDHPLVKACLQVSGNDAPEPFGGISELFNVPDMPGVVMGPGLSKMSHAVDEYIEVSQLEKAVDVYEKLLKLYLKGE